MGTNEELPGIHGKLGRQFAPLSPLPWVAAAIRAGGSPQGEPLCGYHTPSSGCSGLKEQGGEQQDTLPSAAAASRPPL